MIPSRSPDAPETPPFSSLLLFSGPFSQHKAAVGEHGPEEASLIEKNTILTSENIEVLSNSGPPTREGLSLSVPPQLQQLV